MNARPRTCPECGARLPEETTCQDVFDAFLALEFQDAAYGAVHFFTVACFMIQHNRYSDEGLRWVAERLREALSGEPLEGLYRRAQASAQNTQRTWKVTRDPRAPTPPPVAWEMTIQDVASQFHDADSYQNLIRRWAEIVARQMHTGAHP